MRICRDGWLDDIGTSSLAKLTGARDEEGRGWAVGFQPGLSKC